MNRWNFDDLYDRALDIIATEADVPRSEVDCEHMEWWLQAFATSDRNSMLPMLVGIDRNGPGIRQTSRVLAALIPGLLWDAPRYDRMVAA